jgi:hypothetical protein
MQENNQFTNQNLPTSQFGIGQNFQATQVLNPNYPQNQNPQHVTQNMRNSNPVIQKPTKLVAKKSSIFSVHNVLISLLLLYAIFSFCWIAILYAGVDGNRPCLEDNIFCKITVPYTKQAVVAVNANTEIKNQLVKQKNAKNYIRDVWQNQTIINDNLVKRQNSAEKAINSFKKYLENYIKFSDDNVEIIKGFSSTELENKRTELEEQITNLKLIQENNSQNKTLNQKQINDLYIDLGERQENFYVDDRRVATEVTN